LKGTICLDTSSLFSLLQSVLGKSITLGLRKPSLGAPKLQGQQSLTHVATQSCHEDSFNLFFPLPINSLDGLTHRPRHRGVDFHFDPNKRELRVAFRFRRAPPFDPTVVDCMVSGGDGVDSDNSDAADEPEIAIKAGDRLGCENRSRSWMFSGRNRILPMSRVASIWFLSKRTFNRSLMVLLARRGWLIDMDRRRLLAAANVAVSPTG
jgi:hypothetical protein